MAPGRLSRNSRREPAASSSAVGTACGEEVVGEEVARRWAGWALEEEVAWRWAGWALEGRAGFLLGWAGSLSGVGAGAVGREWEAEVGWEAEAEVGYSTGMFWKMRHRWRRDRFGSMLYWRVGLERFWGSGEMRRDRDGDGDFMYWMGGKKKLEWPSFSPVNEPGIARWSYLVGEGRGIQVRFS